MEVYKTNPEGIRKKLRYKFVSSLCQKYLVDSDLYLTANKYNIGYKEVDDILPDLLDKIDGKKINFKDFLEYGVC